MILADFTDVFAKRDATKEAGLGELSRISLWGYTWGAIKSLSGFKRHHRVPDEVNSYTHSFVQSISSGELTVEIDRLHTNLKSAFKYKRRDMTQSEDSGGASIITPDFTVNVTIDIAPDDPAQYEMGIEVTDIRNPAAVADEAFASVFDKTFDRIVLESTGTMSVRDMIDTIEEAKPDGVSVDYERDESECTISVHGYDVEIKMRPHEIELALQRKEKIDALLSAFKQLPSILMASNVAGLLPAPNEEV